MMHMLTHACFNAPIHGRYPLYPLNG